MDLEISSTKSTNTYYNLHENINEINKDTGEGNLTKCKLYFVQP